MPYKNCEQRTRIKEVRANSPVQNKPPPLRAPVINLITKKIAKNPVGGAPPP